MIQLFFPEKSAKLGDSFKTSQPEVYAYLFNIKEGDPPQAD